MMMMLFLKVLSEHAVSDQKHWKSPFSTTSFKISTWCGAWLRLRFNFWHWRFINSFTYYLVTYLRIIQAIKPISSYQRRAATADGHSTEVIDISVGLLTTELLHCVLEN